MTLILPTNDAFAGKGNEAPIANAGLDQTVTEGVTVTLDGSLSSDPDGDDITYEWKYDSDKKVHKDPFKGKDGKDKKKLSNPTFTADNVDETTTITFKLTVKDDNGKKSEDFVDITIQHLQPIANAGVDQTVTEGDIVTLDGTGSKDPNGDAIKYKWKYKSDKNIHDDPFKGKDGADDTSDKPTFTAGQVDGDISLTFELIIQAGKEKSVVGEDGLATVIINILDTTAPAAGEPVANAGPDQEVTKGATVILDGTASSDPDGDDNKLKYEWKYESSKKIHKDPFKGKNGADDTSDKPEFVANSKKIDSVLTFKLIVTDENNVVSKPDFMTVTIVDDNKVDFKPAKEEGKKDKIKGEKKIKNVKKGQVFGIKIEKPEDSTAPGSVKQLLIATAVDAVGDVDFSFIQDSEVPPELAQPNIVTAIFLDLQFTGIDLSQSSSFENGVLPRMQFSVNIDLTSAERFADSCPVMELQLLDKITGIWERVGNPILANTNKIYVTNSNLSTVSVVDGSTNNIVSTIGTGDTPKLLSFDQSANRLYVINEFDNTVSVFNTAGDDNVLISTITVGTTPNGIAVNESTDRLYVVNEDDGTVSVFNTAGDVNIETINSPITVGTTPNGIAVNESTDRIYVTNEDDGTVSVFNTAGDVNTETINSPIDIGHHMHHPPIGIEVNELDNRIYVTIESLDEIQVIDTAADLNAVIDSITVGTDLVSDLPVGMSFNPVTKILYVANSGSGSVSVIDTELGENIADVTTGSGAFDVEVNPNTDRIFVANSGAGTISVIDGTIGATTENTVIDTITGFSNNFGIALNPAIPNPVRDPSADEISGVDQCAYIATPPHFSKFAIGGTALAIASVSGGGGSAFAPSFTKPPTSFAFGGILSTDGIPGAVSVANVYKKIVFDIQDFENEVETETIATGEHVEFRFAVFENSGGENVKHFEFLINLTGTLREYYHSDTYIIYDEEPSISWSGENQQVADTTLTIKDPHGLFENVDFDIQPYGEFIAVVTLNITFANEMDKSDIYLRIWDAERNSRDTIIKNAIEVIDMDPEPVADDIVMDPEPGVDDITKVLYIPEWIKNSAGLWSEGQINDETFVKGIEFLIQEQIIDIPVKVNVSLTPEEKEASKFDWTEEKVIQIPDWVKNNSGWWAEGLFTDEEFVNAIKFLIEKEIIMI